MSIKTTNIFIHLTGTARTTCIHLAEDLSVSSHKLGNYHLTLNERLQPNETKQPPEVWESSVWGKHFPRSEQQIADNYWKTWAENEKTDKQSTSPPGSFLTSPDSRLGEKRTLELIKWVSLSHLLSWVNTYWIRIFLGPVERKSKRGGMRFWKIGWI